MSIVQMIAMFILVIPIWLAFSGPLAEIGYVESVLNAVQAGPVRTVVSVLLLFHFVAVLVMSNNPLFQELEHKFDIPHGKCYWLIQEVKGGMWMYLQRMTFSVF